jgi:xanthine dehydrogenase accessory factor
VSAFHRELLALLEAGQRCASATLVDASGSTPGKQGHRMLVLDDGTVRFTIGGGPLEAMVVADCLQRFQAGDNAVREYRLVPDGKNSVGMVCGGTARVFIELHEPDPQLMVFGAGHVGREIVRMAASLGFERSVVDDRQEMLAGDAFHREVRRRHCPDAYAQDLPATRPGAYVIIVTRCHETDREILAQMIRRPLAYLGMIGSRRKVRTVMDELESRGVPGQDLARVRAPVGLEIGARSPGEIAVAILAEIIAVRRDQDHRMTWPRARQQQVSST